MTRVTRRHAFAARVLGAACLLLGAAAHAQIVGHSGSLAPSAPQKLTPATGTTLGSAGGTPVILTWTQSLQPGLTLRPNATQFLICLLPTTAGMPVPACTVANAAWIETIATPTTALTRVGNAFTFRPGRDYAPNEIEVPLRITVVACANAPFNCTPAHSDVRVSSVNIVAGNVGDQQSTALDWVLDVRADNPGSGFVARYSGDVSYWEVLVSSTARPSCLISVDAPEHRNDPSLWVIDDLGRTTPMLQVPRTNGAYSGRPVVGLYRRGSAYDLQTFLTPSPALAPRVNSRGVGQVRFPVSSANATRAFAVYARHDTSNVVREFDETDNERARCIMR